MGLYQLKKEQIIDAGIDEVWDFISSPANLKKITPVSMGFEVVSGELPDKMYPGMIIIYKVRPLFGIPVKWVTEITHVQEKSFFIDIQRSGPYAFWHHQHFIEKHNDGVLMKDIVTYKPPFGIFGNIANSFLIGRKLEDIFDFRRQAIISEFNRKI